MLTYLSKPSKNPLRNTSLPRRGIDLTPTMNEELHRLPSEQRSGDSPQPVGFPCARAASRHVKVNLTPLMHDELHRTPSMAGS